MIREMCGLRSVAIVCVLLHHAMAILLPATGRSPSVYTPSDWLAAANRTSDIVRFLYTGHFGVHLFFVISGFVLALPFARHTFYQHPAPNLFSYFRRRFWRIVPPHALSVLLFSLYMVLKFGAASQIFPHAIASLLHLHGSWYGTVSTINPVLWSLEVEIQFYLLVPLLVQLFRIRHHLVRYALFLSLITAGGYLSQHVIYPYAPAAIQLSFLNFSQYFLMGFLLTDLYLHQHLVQTRQIRYDLLVFFAGSGITAILIQFGSFYWALPHLAGLICVGVFRGVWVNRLVSSSVAIFFGSISYTVYLYHIPLLSVLTWNMKGLYSAMRPLSIDFAILVGLMIVTLIPLGWFWFLLTEKPFIQSERTETISLFHYFKI